ncbi:MAG: hypothetical protein CVU34_16735 [Betaproteobacteria bacterium HGW-Betaproteobacteria-7]|jgi:hypothetical protein|nr:MAG: hypothetical protein CVU34_16735 [Betaproteobacteria bacterium HGW-Betaproteobacteria-7]
MHMDFIRRQILILASGLALSAASPWVAADPPSRVGRLSYLSGVVSFSPAGEDDWVRAAMNRPLATGDRMWTDSAANTRAEIQVAGAAIRMHAGTNLAVLNLNDNIAQVLLSQGSLHIRVRRLGAGQSFEVATPNLAFTLRQPGEYRIDVDPRADTTTIVVHQGRGEAWGGNTAHPIKAQQAWRFVGSGLHDYERIAVPERQAFDRWAASRDDSDANSRSARFVSADVIGYQDLDAHGSWRADASYGNVWVPDRVAADWAPYSDGHWAWIDPWGWTWIDYAPWGFAVSHYGRWANLSGTWAWVPGPLRAQAYYAPALVAFVGGEHFQLTSAAGMVGAIAWFPLAPHEVYRPSYPVSRRYFENVNRSNTTISNTLIVNQYDSTQATTVIYANRQVAGAVVAVPTTAFVQAQPVARGRLRVSPEALVGHSLQLVPAVVPSEQSVRGTTIRSEPPPWGIGRPAVARSAVPPAHPGLAVQREQLAKRPGRPLDPASRRQLQRTYPGPAPIVAVLAPRETGKKLPSAPAAGRDQGEAPSRGVSPVQPVAVPPTQSPGEPAGKPERMRKPAWERDDLPKFPIRGEATPGEGSAVPGRADAGTGREPVDRTELPSSAAHLLPPSAGVTGSARAPPTAREAVGVDGGRAGDAAREQSERRQDGLRQGQR